MYTDENGVQFSDDKKQLIRAPWNLEGDYVIPSEVTNFMATVIDVWGFYGCKKLTSVIIPDAVKSLCLYAFAKCQKLQKVVLPKSLERVERGVFKDCESLIDIQIPEGVISIDDHAFDGCKNLRSVRMPKSVQYIHEYAFRNCVNLEEIDIPDGVQSIDRCAFQNCKNLTSITIPTSVKKIFSSAFSGCSQLSSINLPKDIYIEDNAFDGCPNRAGDGTIPYMDEYGVKYNGNRKVLLQVPKDFKGAYIIPDGTEVLKYRAFEGCMFITSIIIPDSMYGIQESFEDCISLENILVSLNNSAYQSIDGVLFSKDMTVLSQYPVGKQQSSYIVPDGVEIIMSGAFAYCHNLQSIHLPNSVQYIQTLAFEGCEHLTTLNIPEDENTYIEIDEGAFCGCKAFFETDTYKELLSLGYGGDYDLDAECPDEPLPNEYGIIDYADETERHISWYEGDRLVEIMIYIHSNCLVVDHKDRSVDGGFAKVYEVNDIAQLMKSLEVDTNEEIINALVDECETPHAGFNLRRFFDFLQSNHIEYTKTKLGTYEVTYNKDFELDETFIPTGNNE